MATFASALQKIISLLTDNNNRAISAAKHREVETEIVQAISESVSEGQIPVMVGGKHVGYATLKFVPGTGELQLDEFRLGRGVQNVNEIYNSGSYTGVASKTLVTKRYVDGRRVVVGTISQDVDLGTSIRVGQTVTLDGGISHTIEEGDTFLLKSQTDPAENVPYTAVAADAAPVVADWYSADKNQEIIIEKGPATKQVMPAVAEGEDPVIETPLQAQQITLLSTGWSGNSYSFDTTGVLSILENSNILISPATKADSDLYADAEIFCASQAANTLVFSCVNAPTSDVVLNVIVL